LTNRRSSTPLCRITPQHIISQGYWSSDNLPLHFTQLLEVLKPVVPSSEFAQIAQLGPQGLEARVRQRNDELFAFG